MKLKKTSRRKERERRVGKQKEINRGVTAFFKVMRPFTSAYIYQCSLLVLGHPVLAHPALRTSRICINVRFPTLGNFKSLRTLLCQDRYYKFKASGNFLNDPVYKQEHDFQHRWLQFFSTKLTFKSLQSVDRIHSLPSF